jgi:hypothetical protein
VDIPENGMDKGTIRQPEKEETMKKSALLFVLLFILSGCAGANYSDRIQAVDLAQSLSREASVKVLAIGQEWRNSGVVVKKGNRYKIDAKGRWRVGGLCGWTGPDGTGCYSPLCWDGPFFRLINGWSHCTLLGRIGASGNIFAVGDEYELIAEQDGILYYHINDTGSEGDNEGFVTVNTALLNPPQSISMHERKPADALLATPLPGFLPQNWAVIIGVSKYKYSGQSGLTNLIFADDDAKMFARTLHNLGWAESHIRLLVNEEATKRNIEIALESWLTKAGSNDQVILFWAGHGYPDPENPERVYFACHDTDISIPATGYRMDKVRTALDEIKSKNVILLADTCHAGKLITRGERGISIVPQIDKMAREQKVPKGWVFMVGADTDRQAIEHTSWTNGAFTHSLIKGLSGAADGFQSAGAKDGVVTMGELKEYMNISMPDETQRVLGVAKRPVITTSTGDPDIWNLTLQIAK